MSAVAYIQRHADRSGTRMSTTQPTTGAGERAHRLEPERAKHQFAAIGAWDVLRDDHMGGRIVAAERQAQAEQADGEREEVVAEDQQPEEGHEDDHLRDEHALAAEIVRQAAEQHRAEQDAGEAGGADDALLGRQDMKFANDQR